MEPRPDLLKKPAADHRDLSTYLMATTWPNFGTYYTIATPPQTQPYVRAWNIYMAVNKQRII